MWPYRRDAPQGPQLPIARSGIELIRGSASDSAIATLLGRGLIVHNPHHLFATTRESLEFAGLRDLADLPALVDPRVAALAPSAPSLDV